MQARVVVIEGIAGGLGTNLLAPEIIKLTQQFKDNPQVKFYGTELNTDKITPKGKATIQALTDLGMIVINKSDPEGMKQYESLQADTIFLATPAHTHLKLAMAWLKRDNQPKIILVEKPFSEDVNEARDFVTFLKNNPNLKTKVYAYDFADDNFNLSGEGLKQVQAYLGSISETVFFWMQDHSGADKSTYLLGGDDRPITRENRIAQLEDEKRIVFDALAHFFNPIEELVDLKTVKITDIKASQYETSEIRGETFVATRLILKNSSPTEKPIIACIYAGKGIGSIKTLGMNRLAHMLVLRNKEGKEVRLSIDDATAYFVSSNAQVEKRIPLAKLYTRTMRNLFFGSADFGRSPQYALQCLEVLDQIRNKINIHLTHTRLENYTLGTSKISAPSLEEILQTTSRVYGTGDDMLRGQELTKLIPQAKLTSTQQ